MSLRFRTGRRDARGESWLRVEADVSSQADLRELALFATVLENRLHYLAGVPACRMHREIVGEPTGRPFVEARVTLPRELAESAFRGALRVLGVDPEVALTDRRELVVEVEERPPRATIDDLPSIRDELAEALASEMEGVVQIDAIDEDLRERLVATAGRVLDERGVLRTFTARVEASGPTPGPLSTERRIADRIRTIRDALPERPELETLDVYAMLERAAQAIERGEWSAPGREGVLDLLAERRRRHENNAEIAGRSAPTLAAQIRARVDELREVEEIIKSTTAKGDPT